MLGNKAWYVILTLLFLISGLVLVSGYLSSETFWPSSLLPLLLIPVLVVNGIVLIVLLVQRSRWLVIPLLVLIAGGIAYSSWYAGIAAPPSAPVDDDFSVLSYNTSFFRVGRVFSEAYYAPEQNLAGLQIADWVGDSQADIICLQEFFDDKNAELFNNIRAIGEQNGYQHYFLHRSLHDNGVRRGIVTFSRFPIVNQGAIFLSENRYNGATFVDLQTGTDTIRIINLHLESLNLSERIQKGGLLSSVRNNALRKHRQAQQVLDNIQASPYPVIVCGDFNTAPGSYLYRQFAYGLHNAFEELGTGFGFTYQGSAPMPLLRIDNQFYDPALQLLSFNRYTSIAFSDHFPIEARYRLP